MIFVRVRSELTIPLLPLKIIATALSPFIFILSTLIAWWSLLRRDPRSALLALFGMFGTAWYVRAIARSRPDFSTAFGPDWRDKISPDAASRMLPHRFTLRGSRSAAPFTFHNDLPIATHLETGDSILADMWQPADPAHRNGTGIIYLHGSGWHYLKKDFYTRPFFRQLAGEGYVIADVAYTMAPKADLKGMLADAYRAIAWMRTNAATLGIHPERIVLIGGSAGAHLALLAAYAPHHPDLKPADVQIDTSVQAVISYYGPGDLRLAHQHLYSRYGRFGHHRTTLDRSLMYLGGVIGTRWGAIPTGSRFSGPGYLIPAAAGGFPDQIPVLYDIASPLTHIGPHCPPTLLFHGAHDFAIDPDHSRHLYHALQAAGVKSVYVEFPYTDHVFDLFFSPFSPAFQAATYDTERFLALLNG